MGVLQTTIHTHIYIYTHCYSYISICKKCRSPGTITKRSDQIAHRYISRLWWLQVAALYLGETETAQYAGLMTGSKDGPQKVERREFEFERLSQLFQLPI